MAEDRLTLFASSELLRIVLELTKADAKKLEFLMCQMYVPWTKSEHGDILDILERMKHRMIWNLDGESRKCNFLKLAMYMDCINREDVGRKLRDLGKVSLKYSHLCRIGTSTKQTHYTVLLTGA